MKKLLSMICITSLVAVQSLLAQTTVPFLTIQQIQSVPGTNLANCNDSSSYTGKVVITRGIVVTAPVVSIGGTSTGINAIGSAACDGAFYIQNGTGPWSGILVRQGLTMKNGSTGILSLNVGDSVVVKGTVREYARVASGGHNFPGETHIDLDTTLTYTAAAVNRPVYGPTLINISDLVIGSAGNNLPLGEQWEGVFVRIEKAVVSQVPSSTNGATNVPTACIPPSGSRRRRIVIKDAFANELVVSDRFLAGRYSNPATNNNNLGDGASSGAFSPSTIGVPGGTLIYPGLGNFYSSISGIVSHWMNNANGCNGRTIVNPDYSLGTPSAPNNGSSTASAQGYVLQPFLASHYQLGDPVPVISNIIPSINSITVANPKPNEDLTIKVTISQANSQTATVTLIPSSLVLKYTTEPFSSTSPIWNTLTLTGLSGNDFSAVIPGAGLQDGSLVRYFIKATNSLGVTVSNPDSINANFYNVRTNGTTIYDLQYTPYLDGNSPFAGYNGLLGIYTVTVSGLVASTYNELGIAYIQQENSKEWGGIKVFAQGQTTGSPNTTIQNSLRALTRGQRVTIVGKVSETFKETTLSADQVIVGSGNGTLSVTKRPSAISSLEQEKYEGVLVRLKEVPYKKLKVINNDASARGGFTIGTDSLQPLASTQIMTGVQDSRFNVWAYSSLIANIFRSKTREFGGNDGNIGAQVPVFDTVNVITKLDSLDGLVTYNFNNYLVTPRTKDDFYGLTGTGKGFNKNANPILFVATVTGSTTHQLTWTIPANYGGDGFILDYGMPLSTTSGLPTLSNFSDRTFYRIGIVNGTTNTFTRVGITSTNSGALYRIRGYKASGTDTTSSYADATLLSNIPGAFVSPITTSTGLFQDSYGSESGISVYPNPSSEELNYKILLNSIPNELAISIYDIAGRRVSEQIISTPSQEGSIPTNNLIPGVYLAEFRSGGKVISRSRIIRLD